MKPISGPIEFLSDLCETLRRHIVELDASYEQLNHILDLIKDLQEASEKTYQD